jgi:hypothetical protein
MTHEMKSSFCLFPSLRFLVSIKQSLRIRFQEVDERLDRIGGPLRQQVITHGLQDGQNVFLVTVFDGGLCVCVVCGLHPHN